MKTSDIKHGSLYKLLMMVACRVDGTGCKGFRAASDEYEILVTIKVKDKPKTKEVCDGKSI